MGSGEKRVVKWRCTLRGPPPAPVWAYADKRRLVRLTAFQAQLLREAVRATRWSTEKARFLLAPVVPELEPSAKEVARRVLEHKKKGWAQDQLSHRCVEKVRKAKRLAAIGAEAEQQVLARLGAEWGRDTFEKVWGTGHSASQRTCNELVRRLPEVGGEIRWQGRVELTPGAVGVHAVGIRFSEDVLAATGDPPSYEGWKLLLLVERHSGFCLAKKLERFVGHKDEQRVPSRWVRDSKATVLVALKRMRTHLQLAGVEVARVCFVSTKGGDGSLRSTALGLSADDLAHFVHEGFSSEVEVALDPYTGIVEDDLVLGCPPYELTDTLYDWLNKMNLGAKDPKGTGRSARYTRPILALHAAAVAHGLSITLGQLRKGLRQRKPKR
ncbi:MAG: hypothetical protein P1P84_05295 [Deferrisomatales bacterium]|nr:hypothetical protein [Deferrisomatales bacterium]